MVGEEVEGVVDEMGVLGEGGEFGGELVGAGLGLVLVGVELDELCQQSIEFDYL